MQNLLQQLKQQRNRTSTRGNYWKIWRCFNNFLIRLDFRPKEWEARTSLFLAYLVENGKKSVTLKSYVSGIKSVLKDNDYEWNDNLVLVNTITRACKLRNDRVQVRLPIHCSLLEMILYELERIFPSQPYLQITYKAMFALGYYGLFRIGELTMSEHVMKAKDIQLGVNKDKIMVVLYSSKTHDRSSRPQKIKITPNINVSKEVKVKRYFCPFDLLNTYFKVRGEEYFSDDEPLFIFKDKSVIKPDHARKILRKAIQRLGLDSSLYNMHSLCIGRSCDMVKYGYTVEEIKRAGRWKSNAVFKYIRN